MLVVESKKQLVINTPIRRDVLKVMPHAKEFTHKGKKLLAVPHGMEECLVLRNLGFRKIPSPILSYYRWPGKFKPMTHQRETAAFLTLHRRGLVLNAPGTGKTASAIWAADFLMNAGLVRRVLIVTPLSTMKTVWGTEIKTLTPHRDFEIIYGTRQRRLELLARPGLQIAIINHDGFKLLADDLDEFDLVIYDEATALKNPSTDRFRSFYSWCAARNPWLWLLTGTPFSQTPVDAWALAKLVQSPTLTKSFTGFRDLVMNKVSTFRWVPRDNALETCRQVLQPSIRFDLDDCVDLPETVYLDRETALSQDQLRAFKEMREKAVVSMHDITATNAAVLLNKLIQIVCGVAYNNKGDAVQIDAQHRLDDLKELIEESDGKVIVYVPLRGVQDWLYSQLKGDYDVCSVHGDVGNTARSALFEAFQNTEQYKVLLAHPAVASHGLTLTAAKTVIWYAPIYSLEKYEQANRRIRRIGTTSKTRIVHLFATGFERELYSRLRQKQRILDNFLDIVNGVNYGDQ